MCLSRREATLMTEYGRTHTDGSRSGGQPTQRSMVVAATGTDRIGGAGVVTHGVVGVDTQSDALRIKLLEDALVAVVEATRAYLPPDGIDAQECLNRILEATDNPTINPVIFEIEDRAALQEQST